MKKGSVPRDRHLGILCCFFLSGAAGLVYQVAWAKSLGLIFGHTVYAAAVVLAVFMAGLAAGSAYLGRWGERHTQPTALYARIEFLVAATGALSLAGIRPPGWPCPRAARETNSSSQREIPREGRDRG
jgi:predicted membrane-bound spermidine synthase